MVLGSRRRAFAAAATALAATALALAVGGRACSSADDSPERAVRALAAAARAGDRDAVLGLLGPETRRRLDLAAERAGQMAGGSRRYAPIDLVAVGGGAAATGDPLRVAVRDEKDGRARVEVEDAQGNRSEVTAVEVGGHWRIELSAYPAP